MFCTWKPRLTFLFAVLITSKCVGQSHGLQFSSHEVVPEKRTSLNLTSAKPVCLSDNGELSFEFRFRPNLETYFGYVVRIIADGIKLPADKKSQTGNAQPLSGDKVNNIDIVYNQILRNFNFVTGESSDVFELDSAMLHSRWNDVRIRFDIAKQQLVLTVNGRIAAKKNLHFDEKLCLKIFFGLSDSEGFQTVDLPPMQVRNIKISEGSKVMHNFSLSELAGTVAHDSIAKITASTKNPVWIKAKHQHWSELASFSTGGAASAAFDPENEVVYIPARDSLFTISLRTGAVSARAQSARRMLPPGNQAVYHQRSGQIVNFYIDEKQVSLLNPDNNEWSAGFSTDLLTEYWQANKFISPVDSAMYVIGGYGQLRYKNSIYKYHFPSKTWDTIQPSGDFFMPRYLAALGINITNDTAYILGGYGSNTGDQKINPKHSYELLAYSIRSKTFTKLQQLAEPAKHFAFANSLIIDTATRNYYTLIYARDRFNSSLQLMKGSLDSAGYSFVGDTLPYAFHDIESFVDLYYAASSRKLAAVSIFTDKDTVSTVKIYTLDFPPNALQPVMADVRKDSPNWIWLIFAAGILLFSSLYVWYRSKRKTRTPAAARDKPLIEKEQQVVAASGITDNRATAVEQGPAIYLFGQFHVTDTKGNDITRQFTPLLKELFLLILINTLSENRGISSEALTELLWHNKSEKDAKNNRSVNIAKLKAIVEKLGNITVTKESGLWQIQLNDSYVYFDYASFHHLHTGHEIIDMHYISKLLNIVRRGTFLSQTEYNWLDDVKSNVSNTVIDKLTTYLSHASVYDEAEFIIVICNAIFHFDRLNEEALTFKCKSLIVLKRHALANTTYLNFTREFKEIYQEEFGSSFNEVIR